MRQQMMASARDCCCCSCHPGAYYAGMDYPAWEICRHRALHEVSRVFTGYLLVELQFFRIFTSLHTQFCNGHALFLHLSTLASFSNFVFFLGKLFIAARVSARLGLRLTNDFEIDSDAFTSHGKPAEGTTKISAEQSSAAQQSKPGSNPVCSLSLSLTIKRSIAVRVRAPLQLLSRLHSSKSLRTFVCVCVRAPQSV